MTNDDELLSAYIDGEATAEEVALIEGDPALQAAADALRAIAGEVAAVPAPEPAVRGRHLAAALAAFDAAGDDRDSTTATGHEPGALLAPEGEDDADGRGGGGSVSSLAERRRAQRTTDTGRRAGLPSWLGAAAAAVLVVGGIGFALTRSGDDAFETASIDDSAEASDEAAEVAEESTAERANVAEGEEAFDAAEAAPAQEFAESADDEAMEDEAMEEEAVADAGGEVDEDTAADVTSTTTEAAATTAAPGLFPDEVDERRQPVPAVPTEAEQLELVAEARADEGLIPPGFSRCGGADLSDLGGELTGFVPLSVAGAPYELLVLDDGGGGEVVLVVDEDCVPQG